MAAVQPTPAQRRASQAVLEGLRNPLVSLPRHGQVLHQKHGRYLRYDPQAITEQFQLAVLSYYGNPPRNDVGQTLWPTFLTARQMGKSLTVEYCGAVKTAFSPGFDHVCIADRKDRADYLHNRVHHLINSWDGPIQPRTLPGREARQMTFDPKMGGKMRTLSAESSAVGIGQSPDSFHASECPFWSDFAKTMSFIYPSIINRDNVYVCFEATPWTAGSSWHEHWREAMARRGRHLGIFYPFWDGKLNQRPWPTDTAVDTEELRLLEKYGHMGLRLEHLAFRRLMLESDTEIRRNPELFELFYPSSPVDCWIIPTGGAIPANVVEKLRRQILIPWTGDGEMIYKDYDAEAQYVIGIDPSGFAARDHAALVVLEVWADRWEQVGTYAAHVDPPTLWKQIKSIAAQYGGRPLIVPERNGVGNAIISMAIAEGYGNIFHEGFGKPGMWTSDVSAQKMISDLCDVSESGTLVLRDMDLVDQLATYKNDKVVERSAKSEILGSRREDGRRSRHHWDKVSALLMAIQGARSLPNRYRRRDVKHVGAEAVLFPGMSWDDIDRIRHQQEREASRKKNPWRKRHHGVYKKKGSASRRRRR